MKIFQFLQTQYAILGVGAPAQQSTKSSLFYKRVVCSVLLCVTIVSQFLYIFYVAAGFMENMECICSTSASFILLVWFVAIVHKNHALFDIIDTIEKLIDTSKTQSNWNFWLKFHTKPAIISFQGKNIRNQRHFFRKLIDKSNN